jgi:hypothetical protein
MAARRRDFAHVGGYKEGLPIMEDADLCLRLHECGPSPATWAAAGAAWPASAASAPARAGAGELPRSAPLAQRGRVRLLMDRSVVTSGRRLAAWGSARATWIHFRIALKWVGGAGPAEMRRLYDDLYTDAYR